MTDDFGLLENRLRTDLPDLADALVADDVDDESSQDVPPPGVAARWILQVAAAVVAILAVGGAAWWWTSGDAAKIEAALDDASGEALDGVSGASGWFPLPAVDAKLRGHMVSAWTGSEALFWGGRTDIGGPDGVAVQAYSSGVAYSPAADTWGELAAPEWGHPGAEGVYHDGRVYVVAKGSVTRFDHVTGDVQDVDIPVKFGAAADLVVADERVWVIGTLNRGPVAIPIDSSSGQLDESDVVDTIGLNGAWEALSGRPNDLVGYDGDLYLVATSSVVKVDLSSGESTVVVSPDETPGSDLRVLSGATRLAFVSFDNGLVHVGGFDERGQVEWSDQPLASNVDADLATVTTAGDWLTLLPFDQPGVSLHLVSTDQIVHGDSPLAGYANANAVWTGRELVVWGGQGEPANDTGIAGARWVPPQVAVEEALEEALAALPVSRRFDEQDVAAGVFAREGLWVYGTPNVDQSDPLWGQARSSCWKGATG